MLPSLSRICAGDDTFFQMLPSAMPSVMPSAMDKDEKDEKDDKNEPLLLEDMMHCPREYATLIRALVQKYCSAATFVLQHAIDNPEKVDLRSLFPIAPEVDDASAGTMVAHVLEQWRSMTDAQGRFLDTANQLKLDVDDKSVQLLQDVILINSGLRDAGAGNICAMILQDPFCLYDMLPRKFDLARCLTIAEPLGFGDTHPFYIARLLREKILCAENSGNSFLDKWSVVSFADKVKRKVAEDVLAGKIPEHFAPIECLVPVHATNVKEDDNVVRKTVKRTIGDVTQRFHVDDTGLQERVYLLETWTRQEQWIRMIRRAHEGDMSPFPIAPEWWQEEFLAKAERDAFVMTADQREAVMRAYRQPLSVITGEAGSGKTTVTRVLIDMIVASNQFLRVETGDNLICMAPTGKATRVFAAKTGRPCMTIDRFLCAGLPREKMPDGTHKYPAFNPIVIIDEMSMVTLRHLRCIEKLNAESSTECSGTECSGTASGIQKIVLVGDCSQLPAIGAGDVLHDTIQILKNRVTVAAAAVAAVAAVTHLRGSKRVSDGSYPIYHNGSLLKSDRVKCGVEDDKDDPFKHVDSLQFIQKAGIFQIVECEDIYSKVITIVGDELKIKQDDLTGCHGTVKNRPLAHLQIVTDVNRIRQTLNADIQDMIRGSDRSDRSEKRIEVKYDGDPFYLYVGDKVIVCVNSYDAGVFNGDIGWITDIVGSNRVHILLDTSLVQVNPSVVRLTLAYAVTTHKSQGSDFDRVACVLEKKHRHTDRALLYTMITRGRERVDIVCRPGVLDKVANNPPTDRDSDMFRLSNVYNTCNNIKGDNMKDSNIKDDNMKDSDIKDDNMKDSNIKDACGNAIKRKRDSSIKQVNS